MVRYLTHAALPKTVEAKDSASIILVRDCHLGERKPGGTKVFSGVEVLMIERALTMRFAPGAFVFPGGKVDATDKRYGYWRSKLSSFVHVSDFAFKMAAVRELYEETGILHAVKGGPYKNGNSYNSVRRPLDKRRVKHQPFHSIFRRFDIKLDLKSLTFYAHWVTPETLPYRFNTHFFIAKAKGNPDVQADGVEAMKALWVKPQEILERHEDNDEILMLPTKLILMKLARARNSRTAVQMAKQTAVKPIQPVCVGAGHKPTIGDESP